MYYPGKQSDKSHDDEIYLGDGLYALSDGYQIWLRAERPLEEWVVEGIQKLPKNYNKLVTINHSVALEPAVLKRLMDYVKQLENE